MKRKDFYLDDVSFDEDSFFDLSKSSRGVSKNIVFKFSLNPESDGDLISYLRGIRGKTNRGQWIINAIRTYRDLEIKLHTTDNGKIRAFLFNCIESSKK